MHELTAYLLTTDRIHANESLESLCAQGIPQPPVVIRNVRPFVAAIRPTLDCQTPYSLVLDDDTILYPAIVQSLIDRFRQMRAADPRGYKLNALVYDEAYRAWEMGGVMLFYTPHLREIGWPEAPHVGFVQSRIALAKGYVPLKCDIRAGVQKRGSNFDVYQKFYWDQIRGRAGQLVADSLADMVVRANGGTPWLWFGVLGIVDGMRSAATSHSKDAEARGPIASKLDFDTIKAGDVRRILKELGVKDVAH